MNERIRELHQQAKDYINEVSDNDGTYQGKEYPQAVREKFAELIVKDVVTKMAQEIMDNSWMDDAVKNTYKHFGVEE